MTTYCSKGDRFEKKTILMDALNDNSGSASGVGRSNVIWQDCPLSELRANPERGFEYFNHYLGPIDVTTGDGYAITQVTSGAISGVATEEGGVLLVSSGGNASADDGVNVQLKNCMFKAAANRKIWFEAKVKMSVTENDQYYIGLAGVQTALIAGGVLDDTVDKCGFFGHPSATTNRLASVFSRGADQDGTEDVVTTVDDTYVKLGFTITGLSEVRFYANGVVVEIGSTAAKVPNAVMCLSYVAQVEQTSADAELSVDWVQIAQENLK